MLRIHDLVMTYAGPVHALRGIDLELGPGLFGLLGPNGAGKTTLMRILAGLLRPTAGRVILDGEDVTRRPRRIWPRLGYLPQEFGFYPELSGEDMLIYLLGFKGISGPGGRRALARELLARVNLLSAAGRKVKHYSGGMKQRLGIAQAVAGEPQLLIVDEPTAGLDPEERQRFYGLLASIADERLVLLSTHIVDDVATLCPRFAVIREGRLSLDTTPGEARAQLEGAVYEARLDRRDMERVARRHRVIRAFLVEGRHRIRIHVPQGPPPRDFEPVAPTLSDAYLLSMRESA